MHCKDTILRTQNNSHYSKLIPNSRYDYLFQWLSHGPKTDPTAIQSPTKNLLYHLDKQRFMFSNMALLKITIS